MTVFSRLRSWGLRFQEELGLLVIFGLVGYVAADWSGLLVGLLVFIIGAILGTWAGDLGADLWLRAADVLKRAKQRVRKWWLLRT